MSKNRTSANDKKNENFKNSKKTEYSKNVKSDLSNSADDKSDRS